LNPPSEIKNNFSGMLIYILPLSVCILIFAGFTDIVREDEILSHDLQVTNTANFDFAALVAPEVFSKNLRDTVYTKDDLWLEFRIDQQMLYVHYRNGRTVKYPVSSGIPGAPKSVDSRPGLFAIFHKAEVHKSSQFNSQLNYFMPFNMGVGFHGLQGTGYYAHLGVRPSSHGCVRMRNEDVRELFKVCKIGTLVLAHKGKSARVVAFAPENFSDTVEYTKEECLNILAYNLASIMEGKYFINRPKRFVIDGKIIPKIGINIGSTDNLPERQIYPYAVHRSEITSDKLNAANKFAVNEVENTYENSAVFRDLNIDTVNSRLYIAVTQDMIKKYVHNPLGILPYFPPDR
jgi:hypothetical protein